MQKLVSKNPILRFKLGKKILKALFGLGVPTTYNSFGLYTLKSFDDFYDNKLMELRRKKKLYKLQLLKQQSSTNKEIIPLGGILKFVSNHEHNIALSRMKNSNKLQPSSTKQTIKSKPRSGWSYGYNRSNEISDIKATQQMLKDAGYLFSDKYNVVDGKWGSDTENAYKKYLLNKEKPVVAPVLTKIPLIAPLLAQTTLNQAPKTLTNFTSQPVTRTFNRSEIRDYIRSKGKGAYDYTGAQRRALRMVMNGLGTDEDKAIVKAMGLFKQGGQLVSKNPIVRFKQGSSFGKAFREARAAGLKEFEWNGKKYHTRTKEEEEARKKQPSANKKVTVYTPSGKKETTLTDSTENKKPTYTPSDSVKNKKLFVPK